MYNEIPARDNFGNLDIVHTLRKNDNTKQNYLVLPRNKVAPLKVVIQTYKTVARYGVKIIYLSAELSSIIRQYITEKKLTTKLFPTNAKGLTKFITTMNNKLGISGGINTVRNMYASTI